MADPGMFAQEVQPPTKAELRSLFKAFGDAKDRWKIDGATMKGYYLHTESGYLYIWHQASGILYEHLHASGMCQAVWSSAVPQLNAEIWTVLPLPPTDPASMQSSTVQEGELPNIDVYVVLTIAHESGRHLPRDVLESGVEDFCVRWSLTEGLQYRASKKFGELPPAGQCFALQNFKGDPNGQLDVIDALDAFVANLKKQRPPPWGGSATTLRVEATGAIIGRCCPDLDALCRDDAQERLAQAHCKIKCEQDRFFVCDMETSAEGTALDEYSVGHQWVGPLQNDSLLTVGPLRIRVTLSDMAKDTPLEGEAARRLNKRPLDPDSDDEGGSLKVYQKTGDESKIARQRQQQQYKDRAEERRVRTGGEAGAAINTLIHKFERIQEAEREADEAEASRVDRPTQKDHREAGMNIDGSFVGRENMERAGIGFGGSMGAELIPEVLDPSKLSAKDASKLKTELRWKQAQGNGR